MTGPVTITHGNSYTDAAHTAFARIVSAPPIPVDYSGRPALLQATSIAANYHWRTQTGDTWWNIGRIEIAGRWVTADGDPDPRFSIAPTSTVLYSLTTAPEWAAAFARLHFPHHLHLTIPDQEVTPAPVESDATIPVEIVLGEVSHHTTTVHTVHGCQINGAAPQRLSREDYGPSLWALGRQLLVSYTFDPHAGWVPTRTEVTGPYTTEHGQPNPNKPGTARIPFTEHPAWLTNAITALTPTGYALTDTNATEKAPTP